MAPRKVAAGKENGEAAAEKTKAKPKVAKMKTLGNPTTLSMVVEALKKDPEKKGTSVPAIRNRILAAHPTVDRTRLRFLLRSALNKGIEKGILVSPADSSARGATGRFKLAKPGTKPKEGDDGKTSENADPNVEPRKMTEKTKEKPKKEPVKKVPKKPKADKEESKDGNAEKKVKAAVKTSEPNAAASKPKVDPAEKTKALAPAKKPKAKTEGAKPAK